MKKSERFEGCILCGAIGDAFGSAYENQSNSFDQNTFYPFGKPKPAIPAWRLTDDTQLTLATCETLYEAANPNPEDFAHKYLEYYKARKITGIGGSTLKSFQELEAGGHWSLVGNTGERAAGNGAAMRIAPLAFHDSYSRPLLKDLCNITHKNDEAYVGALCVAISIRSILNGKWKGNSNLIEILIDEVPDTKVRDRLIDIKDIEGLLEIGMKGNDGYVVNSVPLAIAAANKVIELGIEEMFNLLIEIGGDTDTNCSIAGQIAGTLLGKDNFPPKLLVQLKELADFPWINTTISNFLMKEGW